MYYNVNDYYIGNWKNNDRDDIGLECVFNQIEEDY